MSVWYHLTTRWWGSHLEDHQVSGQNVSLYQLTTTGPPDGGAAHLEDHQVSGLYVSLVPADHQMVEQRTFRTTR